MFYDSFYVPAVGGKQVSISLGQHVNQSSMQLTTKEDYALDFINKLHRLQLVHEDLEANNNL